MSQDSLKKRVGLVHRHIYIYIYVYGLVGDMI